MLSDERESINRRLNLVVATLRDTYVSAAREGDGPTMEAIRQAGATLRTAMERRGVPVTEVEPAEPEPEAEDAA